MRLIKDQNFYRAKKVIKKQGFGHQLVSILVVVLIGDLTWAGSSLQLNLLPFFCQNLNGVSAFKNSSLRN